jgi:hypothetical protein
VRVPIVALPIPEGMAQFSTVLDLSGLDDITDDRAHAWANVRYYVANKDGIVLASGVTDQYGVGSRFFAKGKTEVDIWVEGDDWLISEELTQPNDVQV